MTGIYIRFADDGRSIEKCSPERFEGVNGYAFRFPDADAPVDPDPVEVGARAAAAAMGFDFDEQCGYETEADNCDSSTCIGGLNEDHHPDDCREMMRHIARAVLAGAGA